MTTANYFEFGHRIVEFEIYNGYEAVNLQYGLFAKRVGDALSQSNPNLLVLVEFAAPGSHDNPQWELTLRPAVAQAVSDMGWA